MVIEHVFVTTLDGDQAIGLAANMLAMAGYAVSSATPTGLTARRGKKRPVSRKIARLPHDVQLTYDRGRVTAAIAIMPRGNKDLAVHASVGTAVASALEQLLVAGSPVEQCAEYLHSVDAGAGSVWPISEKIAIGCLVAILALVVVGAIIAVIAQH